MNRPTIEQLEALEEGAMVRHAIFGECSVETQHSCSAPGGMFVWGLTCALDNIGWLVVYHKNRDKFREIENETTKEK